MISEHACEHRAQIGSGEEISAFIELMRGYARPVRDHAPAPERGAREECDRARSMICPKLGVKARRAPELGDGGDRRLLPEIAKPRLEFPESAVKAS